MESSHLTAECRNDKKCVREAFVDIDWSGVLITKGGLELDVRRATPSDESAISDLFGALSPEDLRHRFLTAQHRVRDQQVRDLIGAVDGPTVSLMATDRATSSPVAIATLSLAADGADCEFAIATHPSRLGAGASWSLLDHACRKVAEAGVERLTSIETADDVRALQLEREMGFQVSRYPNDPTLMSATKELRVDGVAQ